MSFNFIIMIIFKCVACNVGRFDPMAPLIQLIWWGSHKLYLLVHCSCFLIHSPSLWFPFFNIEYGIRVCLGAWKVEPLYMIFMSWFFLHLCLRCKRKFPSLITYVVALYVCTWPCFLHAKLASLIFLISFRNVFLVLSVWTLGKLRKRKGKKLTFQLTKWLY